MIIWYKAVVPADYADYDKIVAMLYELITNKFELKLDTNSLTSAQRVKAEANAHTSINFSSCSRYLLSLQPATPFTKPKKR